MGRNPVFQVCFIGLQFGSISLPLTYQPIVCFASLHGYAFNISWRSSLTLVNDRMVVQNNLCQPKGRELDQAIHKPPESISSHFPDLFDRNVFFILPFLISAYFQGGVLSLELFRSLGVVLNTLLEVARCMPGARRMWVEQLGALSALYLCLGFVLQKKVRNYGK